MVGSGVSTDLGPNELQLTEELWKELHTLVTRERIEGPLEISGKLPIGGVSNESGGVYFEKSLSFFVKNFWFTLIENQNTNSPTLNISSHDSQSIHSNNIFSVSCSSLTTSLQTSDNLDVLSLTTGGSSL
jgi:hypothetical protein